MVILMVFGVDELAGDSVFCMEITLPGLRRIRIAVGLFMPLLLLFNKEDVFTTLIWRRIGPAVEVAMPGEEVCWSSAR